MVTPPRVDLGTADEVALDILINLLVGFSRDVVAISRVTFGGDELNGWQRPELASDDEPGMPPKVGARAGCARAWLG